MCKFEVFKGRDGQYYFRLKSSNGQVIAQSEGYVTKQSALDGVAAVKRCAANAPVVEL